MQEIKIDLRLNGHRIEGTALYDEENDKVDISGLTSENYNLEGHLRDSVFYSCRCVGTVIEIITNEVRSEVYPDEYSTCVETGYHYTYDDLYLCGNGYLVSRAFAVYSSVMDDYLNVNDEHTRYEYIRLTNGDRVQDYVTEDWTNNHCWCEQCDCYLEDDNDYYGNDTCRWCAEEDDDRIIEGYTESHKHNDHPVFFGGTSKEKYPNLFSGIGFELEVDSDDDSFDEDYNEETARNLCSKAGLEKNEMRFAHDGSLRFGFECISQPHTVEDFWSKTKKWEKMLQYLLSRGYRSHDPGTCGLHIHVSRNMFGKSESVQDTAIAKVYTFYDENWQDLAKVSRRMDFGYCDKNCLSVTQTLDSQKTGKFKQWKERSKSSASKNHYVALNNSGAYTFEYRLGRGTLNAWAFFSWIDLTITLTRNARRITIKQVETNDKVSWLSGISESTARYIYQRGAFKDAVLALYPSIAWSQDRRDTRDDDDDDDNDD